MHDIYYRGQHCWVSDVLQKLIVVFFSTSIGCVVNIDEMNTIKSVVNNNGSTVVNQLLNQKFAI